MAKLCYKRKAIKELASIVATGCLIVLILVSVGISDILIFRSGTTYPKGECGAFPSNLTRFSASKQILSQWHWTYTFDQFKGAITHNCPSRTGDVNVYVNGMLAARSEGKLISLVQKTLIRDCNGNLMAILRAGSPFQSMINGHNIDVSMELRTPDGHGMIAYVDGEHYYTDKINIKDINGFVIAHMERHKLSLHWKWQFRIFNKFNFAADPRVLSIIAGRNAFGHGASHNDFCNKYFYISLWGELFMGLLLIVGSAVIVKKICCERETFCADDEEKDPEKDPLLGTENETENQTG